MMFHEFEGIVIEFIKIYNLNNEKLCVLYVVVCDTIEK